MVFNAGVLFLGLNILAWCVEKLVRPPDGPLYLGMSTVQVAYPDHDPESIAALLRETWRRGYIYAPFVQFREGPFRGNSVNVREEGFRSSGRPQSWPPDGPAIFLLGGSTTFGYGVADRETIPARLQVHLEQLGLREYEVFNFGRGNYYSSQERVLFEQLLASGAPPRLAVFVDGLNDLSYPNDEPKYTRRLAASVNPTQLGRARELAANLPLSVLLKRALGDFRNREQGVSVETGDREGTDRIMRRWLRSKGLVEALASAEGVSTLFVWQPTPYFRYEPRHDPFHAEAAPADHPAAIAHAFLREQELPKSELLDLTGLHGEVDGPCYVDEVHYTALFSDAIALRIAEAIAPRLRTAASTEAENRMLDPVGPEDDGE